MKAFGAILVLVLFFVIINAQQAPPININVNQVLDGTVLNSQKQYTFTYTDDTQRYSVTVYTLSATPPQITGNITFCVANVPNTYNECTSNPYQQSIILPTLHTSGGNVEVDITVETLSTSPVNFTISVTPLLDALSGNFETSPGSGAYDISNTVTSGVRQFYQFNPTSTDQQMQVQICDSTDLSGNNNAVWGAFLFNRTSDHWVSYNETIANYPCGTPGTNGNIKVFDPSADNNNSYLKICPAYIITSGPITNTYFAIDMMFFWQFPQKSGSLSYHILINTNYTHSPFLPLVPASHGNPSYIYVAEFTISKSGNDAVISFQQVQSSSGNPIIADMTYGIFTDFSYSAQVRQYFNANESMASSCFLLENQNTMLVGSKWYTNAELSSGSGTNVTFTVPNFYTTFEDGQFDINLVAYSPTRGSFAYTYQSVDLSESDDDDDGLGGWAIFFIVIGSVIGAVAVLLVLGVIGYFGYMKYQNRSKYELL